MVVVPDGAIGEEHEVGRIPVSTDTLCAYAQRSGDENPLTDTAPIAFALTFLALRRRGAADLRIASNAFSMHGGHDIESTEAIRAGNTYIVRSSIAAVFEKSGRSGPLTVIERLSRIEAKNGRTAALVRERQIVRQRPDEARRDASQRRRSARLSEARASPALVFDVGDVIAREVRHGPARDGIARWAAHLGEREVLFSDRSGALDLGFADLVVPGPMLSAFSGQMLRRALPEWTTRKLSMTFRQSLVAQEPIVLTAMVTERGADRVVCDIVIESGSGEICATGSASLERQHA